MAEYLSPTRQEFLEKEILLLLEKISNYKSYNYLYQMPMYLKGLYLESYFLHEQ